MSRFCLSVALILGLTIAGATPAWSQTAAKTTPAEQRAADAPLKPEESKQVKPADDPQGTRLVGWLELSGPLRTAPLPYAWVPPSDMDPSLSDVLSQLRLVETSDDYLGVVIYLDAPELGLTQIHAIRDGIHKARKAGKRVMVFAEAYDLMGYLLASAADQILLQHKGDVDLTGLGVEEMYLAGLLEKVGAKADMLQIGKFKGAEEPMTRSEPSPEWAQNMDNLLDDLYAQVIDPIAADRGMTREQAEAMMRDSWHMKDTDYVQRRVVDRLVDRDMIEVTEIEFGDSFVWDDAMGIAEAQDINVDNPFALFRLLFQEPQQQTRRDSIAVIHANGVITSGDSRHGDGLFGEESIGSRTLVEVLGDARDDEHIKGVVIQLDSPGGSALASEVIWQAVREVAEEKPVFASVGSMAASGGYYIACAADEVYVLPGSIVGSIGVVGGKIVLGGLYEKLGINVVRRSRGPNGDMFNSVAPFSEQERAAVRASMQRVYDQFTDRVSRGRGSRLKDIGAVAEGRLFTGRQAVANGMADQEGTVDEAVQALADQLGLKEGQYDIVHLPPPMSLNEFLGSIFRVQANVPQTSAEMAGVVAAAKQLMGAQAWTAASRVMGGLMLLQREPVLVLMPSVLVVK